jgi:hypothetical protein
MDFDIHRPWSNKHKNDAHELTLRVFRDAAEQVDSLARIASKPADRRRLEKGADQIMKLRELALDIIRQWEPSE